MPVMGFLLWSECEMPGAVAAALARKRSIDSAERNRKVQGKGRNAEPGGCCVIVKAP